MKKLLLAFLFLLIASGVHASYWVSQSGSDSNDCNDSPDPLTTAAKLTINAGISCLSAGDTLYILGGIYNESVYLDRSGTAENPITLAAYFTETVIVQPPTDNSGVWLHEAQSWWVIRGLEIDGGTPGSWFGMQLGAGLSDSIIDQVYVHDCQYQGILGGGTNLTISNSQVVHNGRYDPTGYCAQYCHGMYIEGVGLKIYNSIIADNSNMGIQLSAYSPSHDWIIAGNSIINNVGAGIAVWMPDNTNGTIENNTFYGNEFGLFFIGSGGGHLVRNNDFYGNASGDIADDTGTSYTDGGGNVYTDPFFVDAPE